MHLQNRRSREISRAASKQLRSRENNKINFNNMHLGCYAEEDRPFQTADTGDGLTNISSDKLLYVWLKSSYWPYVS